MNDHNKKTLRQFQCRDYLWEIFEQMSAELECSVDYLVNESMRQYARSRNYGGARPGTPELGPRERLETGAPGSMPRSGQPSIPSAPPPARASMASTPGLNHSPPGGYPPRGGYPPPPAPPRSSPSAYGAAAAAGGGFTAPPPARYGAPSAPPPAAPAYPSRAPAAVPSLGAPPPLPSGGAPAPQPTPGMPTLFVIFNGQKFPIAKEEFIIGRGSKTADLAIKDGNISRRHAAIIFQNGNFFMKDLGSTNGVEYQGRRVDGRRIEEGDVYQLCDYELRFTYR